MAMAATIGGVADVSSARRCAPVRILPWKKMASGAGCWACRTATPGCRRRAMAMARADIVVRKMVTRWSVSRVCHDSLLSMKRFGVETHYPDEGEEDPWAKAVLF